MTHKRPLTPFLCLALLPSAFSAGIAYERSALKDAVLIAYQQGQRDLLVTVIENKDGSIEMASR